MDEITLLDALHQLYCFNDKRKKIVFEVTFDDGIKRTAHFGKVWNKVMREWHYVVQDGQHSPGFSYGEREVVSAIMSISGLRLYGATVQYRIMKRMDHS